nr:probable sodium/metabolite cotransporter BASS1, chloroplastic [Nicotiana tomentosiformis]
MRGRRSASVGATPGAQRMSGSAGPDERSQVFERDFDVITEIQAYLDMVAAVDYSGYRFSRGLQEERAQRIAQNQPLGVDKFENKAPGDGRPLGDYARPIYNQASCRTLSNAAGGPLMKKTPEKIVTILDELSEDANQWRSEGQGDPGFQNQQRQQFQPQQSNQPGFTKLGEIDGKKTPSIWLRGFEPETSWFSLTSLTTRPHPWLFISKLLNLPSYYAAGLILVGCCPGGTASNIVTYIARGNVALSILMTGASTLSAVVSSFVWWMTPFLTEKLAGQLVAVDAAGLFMSTLQVVLLPVLAGAFLNQYFKSLVKIVFPLMPPIAVATVAVLCGNAIAQSSSAILMSGQQVVLAAALLHAPGFFFGYVLSRMLGVDVSSSRTISIEVGMQNSVLGVVLATQHFGNPLTAVPCAVSSVCHSIFGSALVGIWRRSVPDQVQQ